MSASAIDLAIVGGGLAGGLTALAVHRKYPELDVALIEAGEAEGTHLDALDQEIAAEMDATIDFTIAASEPPLNSMFRDVYAPGEPEPEAVAARIDRILARE